jgi:hypothetical protein
MTRIYDTKIQQIETCNGCPNQCEYCHEEKKITIFPIPEIKENLVKILDMNILGARSDALEVIKELGSKKVNGKVVKYELVCGVDFRRMTQEIANLLHENRFIKIRWAWDYGLKHQYQMWKTFKMFRKAGYKSDLLSVFVLANWKIPYKDCLKKLDILKVWRVKINDCYFDNQIPPKFKPIYWTLEQLKDFRMRCRKHNQLVRFGFDPEYIDRGLPLTSFIRRTK